MRKSITEAIVAVVAWFALILQLFLMLQNNPGHTAGVILNFFSYFTILSNLLVAVSLTVPLLSPGNISAAFFSRPASRSAIALYIFIVGLVYNIVLRKIWSPQGWQLAADNLLHVAVPVLYLVYWFAFTPKRTLAWKHIWPWLIFPALYLAYSLIRGSVTNWYPYFFINAHEFGYGKVLLNAAMVLAAFIICGLGLVLINRTGQKNR